MIQPYSHEPASCHASPILIHGMDQADEPIDEPALLAQLVAWAAPIVARVATQPSQGVQSDRKAA